MMTAPTTATLLPQRMQAEASVSFKRDALGVTRIDGLYQQGGAKIRFPKAYGDFADAVLFHTAGGLTGGDRLSWSVRLEAGAKVIASTQACDKAYRAADGYAQVRTAIEVEAGAVLHWLPQETILYEQSALKRTVDVNLASDARFCAIESVMLGRQAMGEALASCQLHDRWRVKRADKLIYADDVRLDGAMDVMQAAPALMNGNRAFATLLYCGPEDEEQLALMLDGLRAIADPSTCAFSAFGGKIVGRIVAQDTYLLRQNCVALLNQICAHDVPKVWRL